VILDKKNFTIITLSKIISLLFLIIILVSCGKVRQVIQPPVNTATDTSFEKGIFIVNEGNYDWGNASVTFVDSKDGVDPDIYKKQNNSALGDVAESMQILNNKGFIVVNNSDRIEVVGLKDFKSITKIQGFPSPRFISIVDSTKAYVTNMHDNISVVDLKTLSIVKSIKTGTWTEAMIQYHNLLFVSSIGLMSQTQSQFRDAKILVIDMGSDKIIDSIKTGKEPISMVMDKKEKIWILCTGGYDHYEPPTLVRVDPSIRMVEKTFNFDDPNDIPSKLCINATNDTIYFLDNGIYKMPVSSTTVPTSPFIPANGHLYYGLGIQPSNGNIFVSDAKDYKQAGTVYQYDQVKGTQLMSFTAGVIPGSFCFTSTSKKK
jgi:hypothetical protein